MNREYLMLSVVHLLCVFTRTGYEILKDKGVANPRSRLLFTFIFLVMCFLWATWFALCPLDPASQAFPFPLPLLGGSIAVIGLVLAIGALIQLKGLENVDHLVTRGMFTYVRHPMYLGFLAWIVGWSLYHSAPVSFAIGVITAANILYWRKVEEHRLEAQFGEPYADYRRGTWF